MRKAVKMHSRSRVAKKLGSQTQRPPHRCRQTPRNKRGQDANQSVVDASPACAPSLAPEVSTIKENRQTLVSLFLP